MKAILIFITALILVLPHHTFAQVPATDPVTPDTVNRTDSFGSKVGFWIEK